jgi:putative transposase
MIRGIEGANIFWDDEGREHFFSRIGMTGEATEPPILARTLLDNHVHMLLLSGSSGLPSFMRRPPLNMKCDVIS